MPESPDVFQTSRAQVPCRSCVDFKTWSMQQKKALTTSTGGKENVKDAPQRQDCPLDKDELGRSTWKFLHTMAASYPEKPTESEMKDTKSFFSLLGRLYPCEHCAKDLAEELKVDPPKVSSQDDFSQWLCRLHNKVNLKLGKPEFDCKLVNQRWRDGWLDGSCD